MPRAAWLVGLAALVSAPATSRAALDLSAPVICAIVDVYDCSGKECVEVESEAVGVPDLLRLDPAAKTLKALDVEFNESSSPLDAVAIEEERIVARTQQGDRSLILTVNAASGDALLTVSDVQLTLVGYGACARN